VPGLGAVRDALLPRLRAFAHAPAAVRAAAERPAAFHSVGWSHGVEKQAGSPDFSKGSYYFNALTDGMGSFTDADVAAHPTFAAPNFWPPEAAAPGFAAAAKAAARLALDAAAALAPHADAVAAAALPPAAAAAYLAGDKCLAAVVRGGRCHKGRALFYYAAADAGSGAPWCGWHNDHCSLTALLPAALFDAASGAALPPAAAAAAGGGLFVRTRRGDTVRVAAPADALAFQIGECAQVHTGGVLQATPHCVRAPTAPGVERATLAVFMEPDWSVAMAPPAGAAAADVLRGAHGDFLPPGVPALAQRWSGAEQDFGGFSERTFAAYH
jgi:hypothetical protein